MDRFLSLGLVLAVLCGLIAVVSASFHYGAPPAERQYGILFAATGAGFLVYWAALRHAIRIRYGRGLAWKIIATSLLLRLLLIGSAPVLEIDIYRYLWDGAAARRGVNPYHYSPAQVLAASASDSDLPPSLRRLVTMRDAAPALHEVLRRVHFADLTTVYPPVSAAVFALGDIVTPQWLSPHGRVVLLKSVLVAFDMGTVVLLLALLQTAGRPIGYAVAYGWCPLVLKEFANSGHLDSIAVFFTTAAALAVSRWLAKRDQATAPRIILAGAIVGLAIGAKLYAVVLVPLLAAFVVARAGRVAALIFVTATAVASAALLAPMLLSAPATGVPHNHNAQGRAVPDEPPATEHAVAPLPPPRASDGLAAFLTRWEMNDFLFMILVENIRAEPPADAGPRAWFAVVPNAWRVALAQPIAAGLGVDVREAGFLVARALSLALFALIAFGLAWRVYRRPTRRALLCAAFLTLAWFWLLAPTQNPWYWTWALPFAPFTRNWAWHGAPAVAMTYYLRFWLRDVWPDGAASLGGYSGAELYDYVVTWLVYTPWFLLLVLVSSLRSMRRLAGRPGSTVSADTDSRGGRR